jgi:hypothetical protein
VLRIATAVLLLACLRAQAATITTYADRTTFNAAVGPTVVETFTSDSHYPLNGPLDSTTNILTGISNPLPAGTIAPGVTYSTILDNVSESQFNIDVGGCCFQGGFLDSILYTATSRPLTAAFSGPVLAVGFETTFAEGGPGIEVRIYFVNGSQYVTSLPIAPSGLSFYGFRSDSQDIASVSVASTNNFFGFAVDNFTFTPPGNAVTSLPEPRTTGPMVMAAMLALGSVRIRRRFRTAL